MPHMPFAEIVKLKDFPPKTYDSSTSGMERRVSSLEDIESVLPPPPSASSHRRNSVTRYAEL